jgi:heme/copper-type cytochrome/quinol oxidase subunit 1
MQKLSRQILVEPLWLTLSLGLTIFLIMLLFGWSFPQETIDIHLHDTMFVISRWHILTPFFFLVTFIIYFIKEFPKSFSRALPNWLLILIGLILIICLTFLIQTFSQFLIGGWTQYPPLSGLGPEKDPEMTQDPVTRFITNFFTVIQIAVLLMLLFVAYRWGTQKQKEIRE